MERPVRHNLDLNDPHTYHFRIWGYFIGHSTLYVRAIKDTPEREQYYILFDWVQYFCFAGPLTWEGRVRVGGADECLRLLREVKGCQHIPDEYLLELFQLFQIERPGQADVQIVAATAYIFQSDSYTPWKE